ncbi:MAG TPA: hypothetical protein VHM02_06750 [Thermoanaerobaculia bacterium]|nr:hypothetical protein [Thermoanaerobaculia bacterium]
MTRGQKVLFFGLAFVALFWVGTAAAVAWAVHAVATAPAVEVTIRDEGQRLSLRAPAFVAAAAVALVRDEVRGSLRAELGREVDLDAWAPAAAELARQLETMPDATLVEVVDGGDRVEVAKRGDALAVHVRSADGAVDVEVPAELAADLLAALAGESR